MATFNEQHKITLRVNGRDYTDWQTIDVAYGIETAARSFALTATQPGVALDSPVEFKQGDLFELFVGLSPMTKIITGYVDVIAPQYTQDSSSIAVSGRSKTGQIVDCSVIGKRRYSQQRVEKIAARLCKPYGIEVVTRLPPGENTGEPIKRFVVDQGEKVFASIEKASRSRSLIIYDDAQGRLVLQKAARGSFPLALGAQLERGRNVLSGDATFDGTGVYGEYRIKSQTAGDDQSAGKVVAGIEALAADDLAFGGNKRVLVLPTDTSANRARASDRAAWEAANRLGRSTAVNYVVRGWFDDSGELWQPGVLVEVIDSFMRVNADLLVINVALKLDNDSGTTATISLAPEAGYFAKPVKQPRKGLGAWRGKKITADDLLTFVPVIGEIVKVTGT